MALNSLSCADVPLSNYSLTTSRCYGTPAPQDGECNCHRLGGVVVVTPHIGRASILIRGNLFPLL